MTSLLDQELVGRGLGQQVGARLLGLLAQEPAQLRDRGDVVAVVAEVGRRRLQRDRAWSAGRRLPFRPPGRRATPTGPGRGTAPPSPTGACSRPTAGAPRHLALLDDGHRDLAELLGQLRLAQVVVEQQHHVLLNVHTTASSASRQSADGIEACTASAIGVTFSKLRSTTASNTDSRFGKKSYSQPIDTPAAAAIEAVVTASGPCSSTSCAAVSSTRSTRSRLRAWTGTLRRTALSSAPWSTSGIPARIALVTPSRHPIVDSRRLKPESNSDYCPTRCSRRYQGRFKFDVRDGDALGVSGSSRTTRGLAMGRQLRTRRSVGLVALAATADLSLLRVAAMMTTTRPAVLRRARRRRVVLARRAFPPSRLPPNHQPRRRPPNHRPRHRARQSRRRREQRWRRGCAAARDRPRTWTSTRSTSAAPTATPARSSSPPCTRR